MQAQPSHPQASVVIPTYNAVATLGRCLAALRSQTVPRSAYEIIVVDDGSTDDTPALLRAGDVIALRQRHAGPAVARNRGARAARGDVLLFTDADCEPRSNWVERMLAPFRDPTVAGVKGCYQTRQRSVVARFVQAEFEEKYARLARASRIDFVDTHAAGYRRDVFLRSGGFDERFPTASTEDQELSFRLARAGHRLVFARDAVVLHQHPERVGQYVRRKARIGRWKVLVHLQHPGKAVQDSYTPVSQKVQMVLWNLGVMACLLAAFGVTGWGGVGGLTALGLLTTAPFVVRTTRSDPAAAAVAPVLLWVRAAALSVGVVWGIVSVFWQWRRAAADEPRGPDA